MDFNWKDIYQDFLNSKINKSTERDFQHCISSVFHYYLRWQNNIIAEECIPIGATNTIRPDFVLYKDNIPQVVIEAKEPNHIQTERNKEQLFSYMRQKKVDFGLYVGEFIQLYYDMPNDVELPLLIFTLEYDEASQYGASFVELFNFIDFDKNLLAEYCTDRIQEIQKEQQLKLEIHQLASSDEGAKLCKSLLKSHFISKSYSDADVEMLLGDIEISLIRKSDNKPNTSLVNVENEIPTRITGGNDFITSKKRQRYTVNGRGKYCKNGSALELVKAYLSEHPSTYRTIDSIFNGHIPNYVLPKEEVERKEENSFDRNKTKRWHKDSPLISSDGIIFYVTTQVGDGCPIDFRDIVSLSVNLGYKIEPIP
ncbi:MAG: type I restriction endonuclease [Candidatus Cryptobacteroides sp.]